MLQLNLSHEKKKFQNYLQNSKKILLINHRRMDWDAYGSLSAFYYVLQATKQYEIKVVNDENTPEVFHFLRKEELFEPTLDITSFAPDLIISFDAAAIEQLWDIYKNHLQTFLSVPFVVIDHHVSNPGFGSINIIDTDASSTCEITFDIIKQFWLLKYVDSDIATFLLTGLITDTNSFFNTNSSPKALATAGELMEFHPRHQDIIINLFKKKPYNRIKLWWTILEWLKDIAWGKIVWNIVPRSTFIQTQTTDKDISGLIDEFLTTVDGLEVAFLLYELEDKKIKWSFRAKTDLINLSEFCWHFGGWGHTRASGFVVEWKNIFEVEQDVVSLLKKYVE